jgi:hypothetical protein
LAYYLFIVRDYDIMRRKMTGEPSKTEGTFGSFLEMLNAQKTAEPVTEASSVSKELEENLPGENLLEENLVALLALLVNENGGPVLVDDLYLKSGIRLKQFGEAFNVMLQEGLVTLKDGDQVVLAPNIQEKL